MRAFLNGSLVFVDVETTGLNAGFDEIIEFGALKGPINGEEWKTFRALVKPTRKLPQIITQITGLTDADLSGEEPLPVIFEQFMDFIGPGELHAYNAKFDQGFLRAAGKKTNRQFRNRMSCVLELAQVSLPRLASYKLGNVCASLGIVQSNGHRALDDAVSAMQVYLACHGLKARIRQ